MQQQIKDRIIHILGEIVERANSINQQTNQNAAIDIDLVLEDLRLLYREFELLRRQLHASEEKTDSTPEPVASMPVTETQAPSLAEEKIAAEPEPQPEPEPEKVVEEMVDFEPEQDTQAQARPQSEAEPHTEPAQEQEPLEPALKPDHKIEPQPEVVTQPQANVQPHKQENDKPSNGNRSVLDLFSTQSSAPSVGDRLVQDDNSLHQRIVAQKEDKSIGVRMQMTPISNLKEAIGVNEKFLFINELFGGNIQAYNDSVSKLNSFGDMQQAFDYLNELNDQLGWDGKRSAQTIEKIANFVQRRYMTR